MKLLQRISSALGWLALAAAGVLTTLEAARILDGSWRQAISDTITWTLTPTLPPWAAALLGGVLAVVAVVLVVLQFVPLRRRLRPLTVEQTEAGTTTVTGAAVYRSVTHEIGLVDGVSSVTPVPHRKRVQCKVNLIDGANAAEVARSALDATGEALWKSLGIAARPVHLTLTYGKSATLTTRREPS